MARWLSLMLLLCGAVTLSPALAADSKAPAVRDLAVSSLLGLTPETVRKRLADVPDDWPIPIGLKFATPTGILDFIVVNDLMTDPVSRESMGPSGVGQIHYTPPELICQETLKHGDNSDFGGQVVLVFRDGRLESAFNPTAPFFAALPLPPGFKQSLGRPGPVSSVFIARLGELPLEDGLGFLARLLPVTLAVGDQLSVACDGLRPLPDLLKKGPLRHGPTASDMQGLALLPWGMTLIGKNNRRALARERGPALLASIEAGEKLSVAPKQFATDHQGVRLYTSKDSTYGVLTIDMGGPATDNLSAPGDTALVGVRDGRVEWITPSSPLWISAGLLCLDDRGIPGTPRRGCSGYGNFSP